MNSIQKTALLIYFVLFIPALFIVRGFIAPILANLLAFDAQLTVEILMSATALGFAWKVLVVVRDPNPLRRLAMLLTDRPYRKNRFKIWMANPENPEGPLGSKEPVVDTSDNDEIVPR